MGFQDSLSTRYRPILRSLTVSLLVRLGLTGMPESVLTKDVHNLYRYHSHSQGLIQDGQIGAIFIRCVIPTSKVCPDALDLTD